MTWTLVATVLGVTVLLEMLFTYRQLRGALARPGPNFPRLSHYPMVTVIRPIRGRDVDAETNITCALDTGYPGEVETLFVFDDDSDPAYPLVCAAVEGHRIARRPGTARVLVAGPPPSGRTGKLNAMMVGMQKARGELVAFGDSDTRPDRDLLRILVEALLSTPRAGDAFAPVVVNSIPRLAGDVGYELLINVWYGPSVALTRRESGDVPFIMGQLMLFRREALQAIGGLVSAEGQLVDDMYLGSLVTRAGYRNIMVKHPLYIATGGDVFSRLLGALPSLATLFAQWAAPLLHLAQLAPRRGVLDCAPPILARGAARPVHGSAFAFWWAVGFRSYPGELAAPIWRSSHPDASSVGLLRHPTPCAGRGHRKPFSSAGDVARSRIHSRHAGATGLSRARQWPPCAAVRSSF